MKRERRARVWPGKPYPLGATWDGRGTNFALFSENATEVELLLFDSIRSNTAAQRIRMNEQNASVWHCYMPGVRPSQLYAYRVYGPYEPCSGHRFNPNKVLLDPYAKAIAGSYRWHDVLFGYAIGNPEGDLSFDERDSCAYVPKCVVTDPWFDWEGDHPLRRPWNETIIYETHVKGLTARHGEVEEAARGTYEGLVSKPVLGFLGDLGVTAVELMPVHQHVVDRSLTDRGLSNYWGYNTIGFFAPDNRFSASGDHGEQVCEFKQMVKSLHRAGIEVILDVVYNHTAEGNHLGPTLCFRGIDNASYYHLDPADPSRYMDFSGCGSSLSMRNPHVTQFIMDSLRYWVVEMHVDGFRFDLASTLAREFSEVDKLSTFFDIVQQDPTLSQVKLIAEPWDMGSGGYQVGNFPPLWTEWNGKYRDTIRRFWRGDSGQVGELAYRVSGSSDLYMDDGRGPFASINFVTCHDGFTLADLVSYDRKHNEANGEENRDGADENHSWNCGVEGPTDDTVVRALRRKQRANLIASVLLSQGVPMLLGGDEICRSQRGNNNAYCQDNELSWYGWELNDEGRWMLDVVRELIRLRRSHAAFRRRRFFRGENAGKRKWKDITWLRPDGKEMEEEDWADAERRTLGFVVDGRVMNEVDSQGRAVTDDVFMVIMNAGDTAVRYRCPRVVRQACLVVDTAGEPPVTPQAQVMRREHFEAVAHSLVLLCSASALRTR